MTQLLGNGSGPGAGGPARLWAHQASGGAPGCHWTSKAAKRLCRNDVGAQLSPTTPSYQEATGFRTTLTNSSADVYVCPTATSTVSSGRYAVHSHICCGLLSVTALLFSYSQTCAFSAAAWRVRLTLCLAPANLMPAMRNLTGRAGAEVTKGWKEGKARLFIHEGIIGLTGSHGQRWSKLEALTLHLSTINKCVCIK